MRKFTDSLKARAAAKNEGGFSLIDVVVTVAIIVALSVGGFVAYTGLVDSAKKAAVAAAADQVYTASVVAENDGILNGTQAAEFEAIEKAFNDSSNGITVDITGQGATLKVTATNDADATITTVRGAAVTP